MTKDTASIAHLSAGIRDAIESYQRGRSPLDRLIWAIEERLSILEGIADPGWVDGIRTLSNDLEYVNAFLIESGRHSLIDEEREDIARTIERLRALIDDQ